MIVVENFDLTSFNSYKLESRCARAFFPECEEDVRHFFLEYAGERKNLLGSGHNVVLAREWYDDDFLIFNGTFDSISVEDTIMTAEAGAFSSKISEVALSHSLSGVEIFYDIPSSLGGAIVMNAGASGEEIADIVVSVRYLDVRTQRIEEIPGTAADFGYRRSIFQTGSEKVVLGATLELRRGDPEVIRRKMEAVREARWAKQPRDMPNAGSVFKRPVGHFVGPMIEELGLKGYRIGGASISDRHAGIFVNTGGASGQDVVELIEYVRERVVASYGIELEAEQIIVR